MSESKCSCGENEACSQCNNSEQYSQVVDYGKEPYSLTKTLVVTYIEVGNLNSDEVETYMDRIQNKLKLNNTNTIQWFIPVRNQASRVEIFQI